MRIGVDLGGTKIEALALADDGNELGRMRKNTPAHDYNALLMSITDLVRDVEHSFGTARSIGFGTPGSISPDTGLIQNSNSTCLNGKNLLSDLTEHLRRPIRIANDADCFALSEATDGAAREYKSVFGVILGTGVGGGLVFDKSLLSGPNALTGEWGHNPLIIDSTPAQQCYCGRTACIESWISGPALARDHQINTGESLTAAEIASLNNTKTRLTIDRFLSRLAQSIGQVINIIDPECIVFGGGLSNIDRIYSELPDLVTPYIMSNRCRTSFKQAQHGDSSGVRGAAWLWP
ncbi:MAG: ROK family protein [Kordiimonas sp.]